VITTYLSIALALLKLVSAFMTWARERELIFAGVRQAIAEVAQAILVKTAAGKAIMEKVNAMSDKDVDDGLRGLEPK
jgi:hypothetical protein